MIDPAMSAFGPGTLRGRLRRELCANLLAHLETTPIQRRAAEMRDIITETGGSLVEPPLGRGANWGPHEVTVTVHGITGFGETLLLATGDWMRACARVLEQEEEAAA